MNRSARSARPTHRPWLLAVAALVAFSAAAGAQQAPAKTFTIDTHPRLRPSAREAVNAYRYHHGVPPGMPIPDGYVDGGRGMRIHSNGHVSSHREIITVDRERDEALRGSIAFARKPEWQRLKPVDRAKRIAQHVRWLMTKQRGRRTPLNGVKALQGKYRSKGVLIGEIPQICNEGVCRHRSLLFKILCDEAGLNVALARGNYRHSDGRIGGHAWNELHLDNGTVFIVDVQGSSRFYGIKQPKAAKYLNIGKRPMYAGGILPRRAPYIGTVESPPLVEKAMLKIARPAVFATLHYTLDGSNPTASSPVFKGPVPITKTTIVKAIARYGNGDTSPVATKTIRLLAYRRAARRAGLSAGLQYAWFAGAFKQLPAFDKLAPKKRGRVAGFDLAMGKGKDNFAVLYTGYVKVPRRGIYTFHTESDDGSKLWIGDECVVDNDGRHGPRLRSGPVALQAGLHFIKVGYFDWTGDETLAVSYEGPGIQKQPVPKSALFRGR